MKLKTICENHMRSSSSSIDLENFAISAKKIWTKAKAEKRLITNPTDKQLRQLVEKEPGVKKTIYGNLVAESEPTSRAAIFTKNSVSNNVF